MSPAPKALNLLPRSSPQNQVKGLWALLHLPLTPNLLNGICIPSNSRPVSCNEECLRQHWTPNRHLCQTGLKGDSFDIDFCLMHRFLLWLCKVEGVTSGALKILWNHGMLYYSELPEDIAHGSYGMHLTLCWLALLCAFSRKALRTISLWSVKTMSQYCPHKSPASPRPEPSSQAALVLVMIAVLHARKLARSCAAGHTICPVRS